MNDEVKRRARSEAIAARELAHAAVGSSASRTLAVRGLPVAPGEVVSGFLPYRTEIDVLPLLALLASTGCTTALPVVMGKGQPLVFRAWMPGAETVPGVWNIPMPPETAAEVLPDTLLVPLLAFDRAGFRLGYGGGFYDRTLDRLRALKPITAVGVAFAAQEVGVVPRGAHDQHLDWIMTETETIRCG